MAIIQHKAISGFRYKINYFQLDNIYLFVGDVLIKIYDLYG